MKSGLKIRELREKKEMNITQLAAALDVSRQSITAWEETDPFPKGENFKKLCDYFKVEPSFFEVEEEVKHKEPDLIEEYRTMLEFMKAEMSKLNDQNTILVKLLAGNFPSDSSASGPEVKILWPAISKAAGF